MARRPGSQSKPKTRRQYLKEGAASDLTGQVVARYGKNLVVEDENQQLIQCQQRRQIETLVCGDRVLWKPTNKQQGIINLRLERTSTLSRPDYSGRDKALAANITQLVVVIAPEPQPTGYLLDQYLLTAELIGIKALIVINKSDLLIKKEHRRFEQTFSAYPEIGYPLIHSCTKQDGGIDELIQHLKSEHSILVGQSGVGKSSLVNSLIPSLSIQVGRLSEATGLGKHTTSAANLYHLPTGGDIIDSPGVRSFRLGLSDPRQLELGFPEFSGFLGLCRFNDCSHTKEPGCAIIQAVTEGKIQSSRLDVYRQMVATLGNR